MTDEQIAYSIAKLKEYGIVDSREALEVGIGAMTDQRWHGFFKFAADAGLYPKDLDLSRAYAAVRQQEGGHGAEEIAARDPGEALRERSLRASNKHAARHLGLQINRSIVRGALRARRGGRSRAHAPDPVADVVRDQQRAMPVDGDADRPAERVAVAIDEPRQHVDPVQPQGARPRTARR